MTLTKKIILSTVAVGVLCSALTSTGFAGREDELSSGTVSYQKKRRPAHQVQLDVDVAISEGASSLAKDSKKKNGRPTKRKQPDLGSSPSSRPVSPGEDSDDTASNKRAKRGGSRSTGGFRSVIEESKGEIQLQSSAPSLDGPWFLGGTLGGTHLNLDSAQLHDNGPMPTLPASITDGDYASVAGVPSLGGVPYISSSVVGVKEISQAIAGRTSGGLYASPGPSLQDCANQLIERKSQLQELLAHANPLMILRHTGEIDFQLGNIYVHMGKVDQAIESFMNLAGTFGTAGQAYHLTDKRYIEAFSWVARQHIKAKNYLGALAVSNELANIFQYNSPSLQAQLLKDIAKLKFAMAAQVSLDHPDDSFSEADEKYVEWRQWIISANRDVRKAWSLAPDQSSKKTEIMRVFLDECDLDRVLSVAAMSFRELPDSGKTKVFEKVVDTL